jgi:hypothetical protein
MVLLDVGVLVMAGPEDEDEEEEEGKQQPTSKLVVAFGLLSGQPPLEETTTT